MCTTMTTQHSGSGDLHLSLELLWRRREQPRRGPKPGLTLDRVVAAAVAVAVAEGLAAVSMRRVAAELGVGTMSLYRYVPGKGELLDLMLDKVNEPEGDEGRLPVELGWRAAMEAFARGCVRLYLAHPWLLQVDQARPLLGPNALAGVEQALKALDGIGLTDQERVMVMTAVDGFVTGTARTHVNAIQAEQRTGVSDEDFWAAQAPVLDKALSTGAYPTLAQLAEDSFNVSHEEIFEFGLQRLLDGLERFITSRAEQADDVTR